MAKNVKVILTLDDRQFNKNIKRAESDVKKFGDTGTASVSRLKGAFAALAGAISIGAFVDFGNQALALQNRLRGVASSNEEARKSFDLVRRVAEETRSGIGDVADLFANLRVATADMGKTQEEVARISQTFSSALKISGADANASAGAIRQFGQALASGVLRGDEFNSIMEANPVFMRAVADQLGVTIGEMRELAFEGALTADVIVAATEDMSDTIDSQFGTTTATLAESFQMIKNELVTLFTEIEQKTGLFSKLAGLIKLAADNVEFLAKLLAAAFAAAIATQIVNITVAMVNFAKAIRAAYVAGTLLQGVTGVGLVKVGAGIAAATAAIVAMNAEFDDTLEGLDDISAAGGDIDLNLPTAPDQTPGTPTTGDTPTNDTAEETRSQRILRLRKEQLATEDEQEDALKEQEKARERLLDLIERNLQTARDTVEESRADLENKMAELQLEQQLFGLSEREKEQRRDIADIEAERRDAIAEITALQLAEDEAENLRLQGERIAEINDLYDEQIDKIKQLQDANYQQATSFATGWQEAVANFTENVKDEAAYATNLFNTMATGFENAILGFVETGKLSFKDLFKSLLQEIIKMQANRIFMSLFGGAGSIFGGFFAEGGYIPAGQFGIAGERGPEIVNGPARVTGTDETAQILGGGRGTNITYNINAVDVQSFRMALARDPEYIYNLTRVGARRVPG